jgi:hypothetical protein
MFVYVLELSKSEAKRAACCLSAWGRSALPQVEALRCHAGHGLRTGPESSTAAISGRVRF